MNSYWTALSGSNILRKTLFSLTPYFANFPIFRLFCKFIFQFKPFQTFSSTDTLVKIYIRETAGWQIKAKIKTSLKKMDFKEVYFCCFCFHLRYHLLSDYHFARNLLSQRNHSGHIKCKLSKLIWDYACWSFILDKPQYFKWQSLKCLKLKKT